MRDAFADGSAGPASSWQGYNVTVIQSPLTSLDDDVAVMPRVLSRQHGDVLLVGHSSSGP
ncbi:protein of unknown function [Paraburkholderia kururiensis]|uniref:hypothetical protein n=1 Tax=Paraburkholderia kururiensis TaxID=984307 RepID=UPI0039A5A950